MALNVKVGLIGSLDMLSFENMAKNREFPGEYQSGSSWHETNIPLDSRLFSAVPQEKDKNFIIPRKILRN